MQVHTHTHTHTHRHNTDTTRVCFQFPSAVIITAVQGIALIIQRSEVPLRSASNRTPAGIKHTPLPLRHYAVEEVKHLECEVRLCVPMAAVAGDERW